MRSWIVGISTKPLILILALTAASALVSCVDPFHYLSSDPEKIQEFLKEQNILCPGDDRATALALIDWSRRNMVHASDKEAVNTNSKSILQLLDESKRAGYVTVEGCWGTADFFQKLLGAVNIRTVYDTVQLGGTSTVPGYHASLGLPLLNKTAWHADELHSSLVSTRTGEIPAEEIPAPSVQVQADQPVDALLISHREDLINRYFPDVTVFFRTLTYRHFYSDEEIRKAKAGEAPINDVALDRDILLMVDGEIDRLGGPEEARAALEQVIDFPSRHQTLVPVPVGKFCGK